MTKFWSDDEQYFCHTGDNDVPTKMDQGQHQNESLYEVCGEANQRQ